MADIREILKSMSQEDSALYTQHRVEMRRSFITAHNSVLGTVAWDAGDDMFLDYIDITLATLFDRGGRLRATKPVAPTEDLEAIEKKIDERAPKSNSQLMLDKLGKEKVANGGSEWPVK